MKNKNVKIKGAIVLALLLAGLTQTIGFLGNGFQEIRTQPKTITQATPVPLNLNVHLTADGASFPFLLIQQYIGNYAVAHPNVTITYTATGSGKGQRDFINKTVDFAASDAPLNSGQRILAANALHVPETIGSVTAAYNLPGNATGVLNLDGPTIANIYLGNIVNWNDSAIRALNPGLKLPNQTIKVAYRSDSSGTTFVWTSYLSAESNTWATTLGLGPSTGGSSYPWPAGTGAALNQGVATYVNSTPYALGYVELAYVLTNHMTVANIKNPAGNFIFPTEQTTANAVADGSSGLPAGNGDWSAVSLLNEPGANDYPIASFTYFLVYKELNVIPSMDQVDQIQARALKDFLNYAVTTGQSFGSSLGFVPLPASVVSLDQATISSITFTDLSTPVSRNVNLSVGPSGWSQTFLSVTSQDTITLNLLSTDGLNHQWYIDFNNNDQLDANESFTTLSPLFSSTTVPTSFTFKAIIWSQEGIPAAGDFTFRDSFNPSNTGTIRVLPQQAAAPLKPNSSLSSSLTPVVDSSKVTTIGSLVIDLRTQSLSGNLTAVAVDKTSGSITFIKSYLIPVLKMLTVQPGTSPSYSLSFALNVAVLPYALSTDITVSLQIPTASTMTASGSTPFVSRELDIGGVGVVNIIALATVAIFFGGMVGSPGYSGSSDINGDGVINIVDIVLVAIHFSQLVFR